MESVKIIELSQMHDRTDYSDSENVISANNIADQIASLIESFIDSGKTEKLIDLLDHDSAGSWVAFKVAESSKVSKIQKDKCILKIHQISKGNSVHALGAEYWLKEHGYRDS